MEKNVGKNKAGSIHRNKMVTLIVSIGAIILIIGAAMQPVLAGTVSNIAPDPHTHEEECMPEPIEDPKKVVGSVCKNCTCAMEFAIEYMVKFVDRNLKDGPYLLKGGEVVGLIFLGLVKGVRESGFRIVMQAEELKSNITYWVEKLVDPENYWFNVTEILANLAAIAIGISAYLLTLCDDGSDNTSTETPFKQITPQNLTIFHKILSLIMKFIERIH
jgi:hypothetical protein